MGAGRSLAPAAAPTPDDRRLTKVLIVEDEALIAMSLEDVITDLCYEVVGTAATVTGRSLANLGWDCPVESIDVRRRHATLCRSHVDRR